MILPVYDSFTCNTEDHMKALSQVHYQNIDFFHDQGLVFSLSRVQLACVAWRFFSNLRAPGKRESRDKQRQSRKEPGREATFAASPLSVFVFKIA